MPKHILIVDDSKTVRNLVAFIMKKEGFRVTTAEDGLDGLEKLYAADAVDLIVSDVNMPRMDGLTLIRDLRHQAGFVDTPLLVLTTECGTAMKSQARAAGANGWIAKPFDPQRLIDVVGRMIG